MATTFPKKEDAPPPLPRTQERNWTCADEELSGGANHCDALLIKRFVGIRTDAKDPNKFVPVCETCAGLQAIEMKPRQYPLVYLLGLFTWPAVVYGGPVIWRMLF